MSPLSLRLLLWPALTADLVLGCRSRQPGSRTPEPATATAPTPAAFGPTIPNPGPPPGPAPAGMVWIPGGEFSMVGEEVLPDAHPIHRVYVDGFWMDRTEVTNAAVRRVRARDQLRTVAERGLRRRGRARRARREARRRLGRLHAAVACPVPLDSDYRWWCYVARRELAPPASVPASDLRGRDNYPVVHVAYEDAEAYARWAGKRCPPRPSSSSRRAAASPDGSYAWGDELRPGGRWMANTFQGHFPDADSADDGWRGHRAGGDLPAERLRALRRHRQRLGVVPRLVPARRVRPPGRRFGRWPATRSDRTRATIPTSPALPSASSAVARSSAPSGFCTRYLVGARGRGEITTATDHLGFRCVRSPEDSH